MNTEHGHGIPHLLDELWNAGRTPRLYIDGRHNDVEFFEDIKKRYDARLLIDLKANDPLNLEYTARDLRVDLTSSGRLIRAVFPWIRIYLIGPNDSNAVMQVGESPTLDNGPGGESCLKVPALEEPTLKVQAVKSNVLKFGPTKKSAARDKFKVIKGSKE